MHEAEAQESCGFQPHHVGNYLKKEMTGEYFKYKFKSLSQNGNRSFNIAYVLRTVARFLFKNSQQPVRITKIP